MVRHIGWLLLLLVATTGCGTSSSRPDSERIAGKWDAVTIRNNGKEVPLNGSGLEFAAGRLTNLKDGNPTGPFGTYRLEGNVQPRWIDIFDEKRKRQIVGIYKLDGDALTICLNEQPASDTDRPTEFKSEAGTRSQVLMELVRRK